MSLYPTPENCGYEVTLKTEVATTEEYAEFLRQHPEQKPYRPLVHFQRHGSNFHRSGKATNR